MWYYRWIYTSFKTIDSRRGYYVCEKHHTPDHLSKKIKFTTIEHIPISTVDHISKILNKLIKLYR